MKKIIALLLTLTMLLALVSCTVKSDETSTAKAGEKSPAAGEEKETPKKEEKPDQTLTLYFCDSEAYALHPDVRKVDGDVKIDAGYAIGELIKGTSQDGLISVIPAKTAVNSYTVKGGLCTVDLSAHFLDAAGSTAELFAIYSIVNTLCGIDGIDEVQFTIDGQKVMAYGSYQFDEPFEADMSLVQQ